FERFPSSDRDRRGVSQGNNSSDLNINRDAKLTPVSFSTFGLGEPRPFIASPITEYPQPMPVGSTVIYDSPVAIRSTKQSTSTADQKPEVLSVTPKMVETLDQNSPLPPGSHVVEGNHASGGACGNPEGACGCPDDACCCPDGCWGGWLGCRTPIRRALRFLAGDGATCVDEPCRVWFDADY